MPEQRPNILLVQADQMAAPALPFHGHTVVQAPHLTRLAERGVVFDKAYCNSPICAPSRFSMLSGLLPSAIGAYDNAAELPAAVPTVTHHLRLMGYRTVVAGKMHFVGPDQLHGFEERLTTDIYPADFGWTPNWERPDERQDYYHTMASVLEAGPCARSMQLDFDDEVAYQSVRKIYDLARDGDPRPFFLYVSFTHPHDPYTISRPYWDLYEDAEIDPPAVPAPPAGADDPHSRRLRWVYRADEDPPSEAQVLAARRAYYGCISYVDDRLGELLEALEVTGASENTIIVFTSDHGDMLGERGLWYKMHFFEWAARVPLIVSAPGRLTPRRVGQNVSLVDLFPTLTDLAGGDGPEPATALDGQSLVPLAEGAAEGAAHGGPEAVLSEYLSEGAAGPLVMVLRGRHKYIVGVDSPPQLFDLEADPQELSNLAGSAETADIEAALAAEVAARWDLEGLLAQVIESQRRRRLTFEAGLQGRNRSWDFQPMTDAARLYARNTSRILGDLEGRARLDYPDAGPLR